MREEVVAAAHALDAAGLVTAFGHVSFREGEDGFRITPPKPLGSLEPDETLLEVSLAGDELPEGVPGEAWIHWAIYKSRSGVAGICRAQPPITTAITSAGVTIRPLHGQGAFLGEGVPVYDDARLIRDREAGEALAGDLRNAGGIVMRGNGAVTVGSSVGSAVARMWVLEASAEINRTAASAGTPQVLNEEEFSYWESVSEEILERIWSYLKATR
ncbi:MAG TPA: class II aldolase/adducin family protein [Rubrobacteraceae bacterium]|nr:class II aldolase/adducin family protein [Rubrobacteraceae bacterium]